MSIETVQRVLYTFRLITCSFQVIVCCFSFSKYGACSFRHGNGCLFAHGSKELNEWRKYLKGEEKTNQPISVPDTLCQELRRALKNEKFSVVHLDVFGWSVLLHFLRF